MRILIDIRHLTHPNPSGVGEYTLELLRALFHMNTPHQYVLLSTGTSVPDVSALFPSAGDHVTHTHVSIPNKLLNMRMGILRHPCLNWCTRESVDLVFLPNLNIAPLPEDLPMVLTVHDLSWKFFPEFYSKKMNLWHKTIRPTRLIARANHIITPSMTTRQDLTHLFGYDPERIHVISHGVHPRFTSAMEARDHGVRSRLKLPKRFALFVGTIEPRKNLLSVIEAVKTYRDLTGEDLHLVLVGKWGWNVRQIKKRLFKRDTKLWVHQKGYVAKEDLPALYRSAKVFLWPSIYEGFGLPVLEAMACGTPVITSHTSSLPEVTQGHAVHVDPYNTDDLVVALRGVLGSNALSSQLATQGKMCTQNYSWTRCAQETLNIFQKTTKQR